MLRTGAGLTREEMQGDIVDRVRAELAVVINSVPARTAALWPQTSSLCRHSGTTGRYRLLEPGGHRAS